MILKCLQVSDKLNFVFKFTIIIGLLAKSCKNLQLATFPGPAQEPPKGGHFKLPGQVTFVFQNNKIA